MNPNYSYPNTYSYPAMNNNVPNPVYNQAPPPGMGVQQNNPPRTEFPSQNYNPYQQPFYPHPTNQNGASNPPVYHFPTEAQNNQQHIPNQTYNPSAPQNPAPNHSVQNNAPPPTAQNPPQIPQNHQQPSGNILNGPNAVPLNQRVIPPPKYYKSNKGKPRRDAPYRRPDPVTKKADPKKVPAPGVKKLLTEVLSEISTLSDALNKHAAEFSRFFQFIVNQAKICDQEDEREKQARKAEDGKEKPAENGKEKQTERAEDGKEKQMEEGEKQPEPDKED